MGRHRRRRRQAPSHRRRASCSVPWRLRPACSCRASASVPKRVSLFLFLFIFFLLGMQGHAADSLTSRRFVPTPSGLTSANISCACSGCDRAAATSTRQWTMFDPTTKKKNKKKTSCEHEGQKTSLLVLFFKEKARVFLFWGWSRRHATRSFF